MKSTSLRAAAAGAACAACVVIAMVAAVVVDVRLDRHWALRGIILLLALLCAGILAAGHRMVWRAVGFSGLVLCGLVVPVSTTVRATPPEVDFALAVADDAIAAVNNDARSIVSEEDVRAATLARGGAVGTLKSDRSPRVQGADAFPLILRPQPNQARPRICVSFTYGTEAKVRSC